MRLEVHVISVLFQNNINVQLKNMKINGLQQRLVLRLTFASVFWSLHASASNITM